MPQPELERSPSAGRRIRHEARDGLSAAGVSLGGSVLLTVLIWVAVRWLG
jgi:hypothetical protein